MQTPVAALDDMLTRPGDKGASGIWTLTLTSDLTSLMTRRSPPFRVILFLFCFNGAK